MTGSHLRYLLVAASAAAAGVLAACGSPHAPTSPGGLTDRLVLQQTHVTAGTPIKGWLVVTYRGRAPVNISRGCLPHYEVVVTNHRFPAQVAFPANCEVGPFVIKPGENRLAVTAETRYLMCTQVARLATSIMPACLQGRQKFPPLPPGRYEAVLVGGLPLPLPAPAPIPVTLAAAS
jgi:hypothetical protein